MTSNFVETFTSKSYGLGLPNPYPYGVPEELPRNASSTALASSIVAFVGQGRLFGFSVSSTRASSQFIQLFDLGALPSNGAIPVLSLNVATGTSIAVDFGSEGRWGRIGCVIANSTTQGSLTLGSADCLFDVQYLPQVI